MNIVLFDSTEIEDPIPLYDERALHILNILHKKEGDTFEAGILSGQGGIARITKIDDNGISFLFTPNSLGKPLVPIIMLVGFPRPIQLKRLFRDMAGLGVSEIHLLGTELGEKSYLKSNIVQDGAAYLALKDGAVQAKSTYVPSLFVHEDLKACLASLITETISFSHESSIKVELDNKKPQYTLNAFLAQNIGKINCIRYYTECQTDISPRNAPMIYGAIGSERGWTDNERSLFEQYKFTNCSMGNRVLRTETAATVATSLMLSHLGVL